MKKILTLFFILFSSILITAQDAETIVQKAYNKTEGSSQYAEMTMQIVRPKWQRQISFKFVSLNKKYSLVLITAPAKEKGQTFLKVKNEMWMWNPKISRVIKLGPSMMSQGWMSSDYSNDELLNSGSIITDYNKKIIGSEKINNIDCYKIQLKPKSNKNIIWGKQILWISKNSDLILKQQFFDEDNFLVKTHLASDIKIMDGRKIPTKFEIIDEDNPDNKTIITINQIKFNIKIDKTFFSQQNMRRGIALRFPK
jgi:outer membrane lipoprotein-sorting protein